jgi:hypothetical protein
MKYGLRLKMPNGPKGCWLPCFQCGSKYKCAHREVYVELAIIAGRALHRANAAIARAGLAALFAIAAYSAPVLPITVAYGPHPEYLTAILDDGPINLAGLTAISIGSPYAAWTGILWEAPGVVQPAATIMGLIYCPLANCAVPGDYVTTTPVAPGWTAEGYRVTVVSQSAHSPEPQTWALILIGMALFGAARYMGGKRERRPSES